MLKDWLPGPPHVGEDSLPEVPPQKLIYGSSYVIQETAVQRLAGDPVYI